ncbi:hypothetical protein GE21DRAFT_1220991, partial [Neurospora crassa]
TVSSWETTHHLNGAVYTGRYFRVTRINHVCVSALRNRVAYSRYARDVWRGITSRLICIEEEVHIIWFYLRGSTSGKGDGAYDSDKLVWNGVYFLRFS